MTGMAGEIGIGTGALHLVLPMMRLVTPALSECPRQWHFEHVWTPRQGTHVDVPHVKPAGGA